MDKRDAILDAALELFAERGFHGTSVAMIAEKAQVGAGTIYRYFADKDVLVNSLYRHWKTEMMKALLEDMPSNLPPRQMFHEIWSRMREFTRNNPKVLRFLEFHHHTSYLDQESQSLHDRIKDQFSQFFENYRQQQVIKDSPPILLQAIIMGAFIGVEKAFAEGWIQNTPELDAQAEEICWEAIRR